MTTLSQSKHSPTSVTCSICTKSQSPTFPLVPDIQCSQEHKEILLDSILNYTVLSHRNMLACAQLSIMTLRHVFDNFATSEVQEILHYCKEKLEELAKVVQQKASELLSSPHK